MKRASFRFYAALNDFLPEELRQTRFRHPFRGRPGVKDVIESLGPPHTEIDLILVNGISVDFGHGLQDGDQVSVYPRFQNLEIAGIFNVRPPAVESTRFVLDVHLGRLAAYLRMLGFDSLYWNAVEDRRLARIAQRDKRILLTRDRGLLKRNSVIYGYCVRSTQPRTQLQEVALYFNLRDSMQPFKRCMRCNRVLEDVREEDVEARLPVSVRQRQLEFRICPGCERVYWRGSHYERMISLISLIDGLKGPAPVREPILDLDEDHLSS